MPKTSLMKRLLSASLWIAVVFLFLTGCRSKIDPPTPELPVVEGLSRDQVATLVSLEQIDDYPLYTMHYQADYGGLVQDGSARLPWMGRDTTWACSLFASLDPDSLLYGRNFDWEYSPALLLFTDPPDRYASVSMVALQYLVGDRASSLLEVPLEERQDLLNAPRLPFDGMNEMGLVVGMAAVAEGNVPPDPGKPTIGSLGVIRQMLDKAANVEQALEILKSYNVDFEGGPPLHYLLADVSGSALLVEFYNGEVVVTPNENAWHLATNYITASGVFNGRCSRYDAIQDRMESKNGKLDEQQAMDLLEKISQNSTQWSVVYGMKTGRVAVSMGRGYDSIRTLELEMEAD